MSLTLVTLVFWGWVRLGTVGAVLAVPLTLFAKALLVDVDPRMHWADAILGSTAKKARRNAAYPGAAPPAPGTPLPPGPDGPSAPDPASAMMEAIAPDRPGPRPDGWRP